jgi:hypothetical protein
MHTDKKSSTRRANRPAADPARHARKCEICHHSDRDAIEGEFIDWHHPDTIVDDYELNSRAGLYRHAHAVGLFRRRRRNLRCALELVIQEAERTSPTADAIIRAVRAQSRVTSGGRWIEAPKYVVISRGPDVLPPGQRGIANGDPNNPFLIETPKRLEIAVTDTKQMKEVLSNRDNLHPKSSVIRDGNLAN